MKISSKSEAETLNFIVERSLTMHGVGLNQAREFTDMDMDEFRRLLGLIKANAPEIGVVNLHYDCEIFTSDSPAKMFLSSGGFVRMWETQQIEEDRIQVSDRLARASLKKTNRENLVFWVLTAIAIIGALYAAYDIFIGNKANSRIIQQQKERIEELELMLEESPTLPETQTNSLPILKDTLDTSSSTN